MKGSLLPSVVDQLLNHLSIEKGLTAGEVVFLYTKGDGFFQPTFDVFKGQKTKAIVLWATTDKAMVAGEITQCARDLKPKVVQV